MENVGPVILFLVYMAISAWAKQRKSRQGAAPKPRPAAPSPEMDQQPQTPSFLGNIIDEIKSELKELEEEVEVPVFFQQESPGEPEAVVEESVVESEPQPSPDVFAEGSDSILKHREGESHLKETPRGRSANTVLESSLQNLNVVQQGVVLREILGKPRGLQTQSDWFTTN